MHGRSDAGAPGLDPLEGGGEAGGLMRAHDWSASPLGRPQGWPQPLKTLVGVMLGSNQPMFVAWGPERTLLYNDPYAVILAAKHPSALGRDFLEVWSEIRADLTPIVEEAYAGRPVHMDEIELVMHRRGYPEETHFSFFYAPVRDESGRVGGLYCACTEITGQVLAERRRLEAEAALRAERDRTRRVLDGMAEGFGLLDREFRVIDINAEGLRIEGRPREEIIGKTHWEAWPGSEESELGRLYKRAMADRVPVSLDHCYSWPDGRRAWLEMRAYPTDDGLALFWRDVSERRNAAERLRESEARLSFLDRLGAEAAALADADAVLATTTRLMGEHLNLSVCAYADMDEDQDGFTIRGDWAAPGARSIVGHYRLADFGKLAVRNLSAGLPLVVNDNLRELAPEEAATFQSIGIAATVCMPLVKGGRLTALMAIHDRVPRVWTEAEIALLREVTARSWAHVERVAAIAELRASEARFRLMTDAVPQIVWITDPDGRAEFFNKQWSDYTGAAEAPPTASAVAETFVHPDDAGPTMAAFDAARRAGTTFLVEHRIRSAAGDYRWFLVRGEPHRDPRTGEVVRWFGASVDIHDRRVAEARLRELNETLETQVAERTAERDRMWETSPDLMLVIDFEGYFRRVNPAWTELLGYAPEELLGHHVTEFVLPEDRGETVGAYELAAEGGRPRLENRYRHKNGSVRWISWVAAPARDVTYATGRDVTPEKERQAALEQAQDALRQAQKMEAVGQLTGGVAHDFNNLLTVIKSSTDLLRRPDLPEERRRRYVEAISDTVDRASRLTGQLLAFARRQALKPEVLDTGERILGIAEMLRSIVGARIRIVTEIAPEPCFVQADASQFETAIVNMAVNARDAMEDEGTLTIRVENLQEMPPIRGHAGGPGRFVAVSLTDTGHGIAPDKVAQIFEPFFTTKEVGKGTGLGLSQVFGFAKQSGGDIEVESRVGRGTTFTLYLPQADNNGATDSAAAPDGAEPIEHGRGRRVLVVEDNVEVGQFSTQILEDLGYETTWAANADEALRLIAEVDGFDVVFSDVVMPGMSGVELGQEIRRRHPGLPVVLTSGYSHVLAEEGRHGFELIQKPYAAEELSRVLRRVMRGRRAGTHAI